MIPMLVWLALLAACVILAWRSLSHGGMIWAAIGGVGLVVFGAEMWGAAPVLVQAIKAEQAFNPQPVLHWWVAVLVLAVFFRPHRRAKDQRTS